MKSSYFQKRALSHSRLQFSEPPTGHFQHHIRILHIERSMLRYLEFVLLHFIASGVDSFIRAAIWPLLCRVHCVVKNILWNPTWNRSSCHDTKSISSPLCYVGSKHITYAMDILIISWVLQGTGIQLQMGLVHQWRHRIPWLPVSKRTTNQHLLSKVIMFIEVHHV